MDTNTLQTLITLLAQKAAPTQSVWQTGFGQLVPYIIAALAAVTVWLNAKAAASAKSADVNAKLALEKTIEGNKALAEVDKKVNGTIEVVKSLAREDGLKNGRSEERSRQSDVERTIVAVKEAIKETTPVAAPASAVGKTHNIEVVDSIKAVISPSKDS